VEVGKEIFSARVGVAEGLFVAVAVGAGDNSCDSGAEDGTANAAGCVCAAVGGALLCASRTINAMIATKTNAFSRRVFIFHHSSHATG
jgi:hypothetical protein